MQAQELLSKVPLFAEVLDGDQLRFLAEKSRPAFFRADTRLMSQGTLGGAMYVITTGEVAVTFVDEEAREKTVAKLGPGEIVGEMSLFTGDRRTATVSALTNVDALEITKASLERVFAKSPELVDRIAAILARRQAELNAIASTQTAPARDAFIRQARATFAAIFGNG